MTNQSIAMRDAFGQALVNLADKYDKMVVLDADVSSSTKTIEFGKIKPERFLNVGVAEANMVDIAGGLATCGLRPIVSTFAIFLALKCTDQIRNVVCYNNLPVIFVGGYAGLSDSFDGASHQSVTDLAIMRAMPNMTVLVPGDPTEVQTALEIALENNGPTYIRLSRNPSPILFEKQSPMEISKNRKLSNGSDITMAVCGIPTFMAIEATEKLMKLGVSVDLLQVSTLKPLDIDSLITSVSKTGKILTIEEHSVIGGLGGAIAEALGKHCPVKMDYIGIEDVFAESGPYPELMAKYGISVDAIVDRVKNSMEK